MNVNVDNDTLPQKETHGYMYTYNERQTNRHKLLQTNRRTDTNTGTQTHSRLGKNKIYELCGVQFLLKIFCQICKIFRQIWILEHAYYK